MLTKILPHDHSTVNGNPLPEDFDAEWETLKANTYARMVANGQLDPDTCAEVDQPLEEWIDSLPDDCHSDAIDNTYSDAADFPIDDDDAVPFEDNPPYFHRELPDGSDCKECCKCIERLYSRLQCAA